MPLTIDAESLLPLLDVRARVYAHRAALAKEWRGTDDAGRMELLKRDRGKHPYRDADDACRDADHQLCEAVDQLTKAAIDL